VKPRELLTKDFFKFPPAIFLRIGTLSSVTWPLFCQEDYSSFSTPLVYFAPLFSCELPTGSSCPFPLWGFSFHLKPIARSKGCFLRLLVAPLTWPFLLSWLMAKGAHVKHRSPSLNGFFLTPLFSFLDFLLFPSFCLAASGQRDDLRRSSGPCLAVLFPLSMPALERFRALACVPPMCFFYTFSTS